MKFSKQTTDILKNFSLINASIMLTKGSFIMTKSINSVNYAEAEIPDVIDADIGIYDLNNFLSQLSIVGPDAELIHNPATGEFTITGGRMKIVDRSADETTISKPKKRLVLPVADLIFEIKAADFEKLIKASRSMKLPNLSIEPIDGRLVLTAKSAESESTFSLDIGEYEGDNVFNFDIKVDNLQYLSSDYKVEISAKGAAKFTSETLGVAYVVVLEATSKFQ